jgi:hypothetical protein
VVEVLETIPIVIPAIVEVGEGVTEVDQGKGVEVEDEVEVGVEVDEVEVAEMMIFCEKVGAGDEAPSTTSKHNTTRVLRVVMLTMD